MGRSEPARLGDTKFPADAIAGYKVLDSRPRVLVCATPVASGSMAHFGGTDDLASALSEETFLRVSISEPLTSRLGMKGGGKGGREMPRRHFMHFKQTRESTCQNERLSSCDRNLCRRRGSHEKLG